MNSTENSPDSLDTIHDLFSSARHKTEACTIAESMPLHADLYEQIAQLESIDENEVAKLLEDDGDPILPRQPITLGDFFEGLAQLATMGVVEVTDIVEAIHREVILRPLGRFNDEGHFNNWQRGITGRIYGTVRHIMLLVGNNLSSVLRLYKSVSNDKKQQPLPESLKKLVNVFNGVMGDHLVNHNNALAISMALYDRYGQIQRRELSGRVIILCHGLCMSHLSWQPAKGDGLGDFILNSQPDATVLYLDYNTGRRISRNGHTLSKVLQNLVDNNPALTQIDLVGHSMGGLVARSALFYGQQDRMSWVKGVGNLVTLGSPHHGAILERIGFMVQDIIAKLPFAGSLAKLGDMRSAGIIDLRHGSIRDADWKSLEGRNVLPQDFRHPARLPRHVNTFFAAATLIETYYGSKVSNVVGDGLVSIDSALGEHADEHTLMLPDGNKAIFYGVSHMNLMYNERVFRQVVMWLLDNGKTDYSKESRVHSYPDTVEVVI
ncbi:alpha/beta fold hydrolase [uncultured Psychrobacter sp.]|uniref:alpha/beta fold hydrolase n=1 Tax=unclassified Psychrobacter TaxID=196806 RepID=UPI00293D6930|nr:alpha/beta fold hydrolase [uncultured Psychrobacter sp.]